MSNKCWSNRMRIMNTVEAANLLHSPRKVLQADSWTVFKSTTSNSRKIWSQQVNVRAKTINQQPTISNNQKNNCFPLLQNKLNKDWQGQPNSLFKITNIPTEWGLWIQFNLQTSCTPQETFSKLTVKSYLSQQPAIQGKADPDRSTLWRKLSVNAWKSMTKQ